MTATGNMVEYSVYHQAQHVELQEDGNNTYLEFLGVVTGPLERPEQVLATARLRYPRALLMVEPTEPADQLRQHNYLESRAQQ